MHHFRVIMDYFPKIKEVTGSWPCSFQEQFVVHRLGHNVHNHLTKFELSMFTHYADMKSNKECRNWRALRVRGNPSSPPISPFNTAHTTSCSTLIETMRLSCTLFALLRVICQKSPILTYPPAFGAPLGVTVFEFRRHLWRQKTRVPGWCCSRAVIEARCELL